ncbi:PulJ/GspJ family protein [Thalassococcus lentus]|uniref:Prepilin-type N-terminal cleavage/methylation domain-containing protein n=1 Tax=Thalassococcus lentus TaxID=1210524 RepID=A0ABT4XUJ9_9RHOB|nr:hypothetical protein [Thalassococcus lentus]MDA7425612.1 hypothetical protein [Thalassococcus lentus]
MRRSSNSGVSQLEMMISLIIMALIAALLANVLDFNRQVLDRSTTWSEDTTYHLARHDLRNFIENLPIRYGDHNAQHFFEGTDRSMTFRLSVVGGGDDEELFALALESGTLAITRRSQNIAHPVLSRTTNNLLISYFGRVTGEPDKSWHSTWSDPTFLPDLVKIEWDQNGQPAPPLTLQPAKHARQRYISLSSLVPPG